MKILIIDRHILFRDGLASLLSEQPDLKIVGSSGTAQGALAKTLEHNPDVVLMDTHLADGNCLILIDEILSYRPETEIIILSDDKDNEHFLPAIRHGARGYLRKDVPTTELVKSIQVLTKDQVAISREMIKVLMDEVHRLGDIKTNGTEGAIPDRLTPREKEVLQYLIEGFTNNEIAVQLSIAENTVRVHVGNILRKLDMKNRREIYQYYSQKG